MNLRKDHSHESSSTQFQQVPLVVPAALFPPPRVAPVSILFQPRSPRWIVESDSAFILSLAAVDALARVSMKDAANCDTHSDVRNSVNL